MAIKRTRKVNNNKNKNRKIIPVQQHALNVLNNTNLEEAEAKTSALLRTTTLGMNMMFSSMVIDGATRIQKLSLALNKIEDKLLSDKMLKSLSNEVENPRGIYTLMEIHKLVTSSIKQKTDIFKYVADKIDLESIQEQFAMLNQQINDSNLSEEHKTKLKGKCRTTILDMMKTSKQVEQE